MTEQPADFFWEASAAALAHGDVATGTMMGFPCLRVSGAFLASCDHRSGDLIVKLPRHRVEQLIGAGAGEPFAPAGRTFREWVLIGDRVILDTTRAQLLFEDERRPRPAVPKDALLAPLAGPASADNLDGRWWAIELDGTRHDQAVRTWDTSPADCPALAGLAVVHHDLADQRLERPCATRSRLTRARLV